MKYAVLDRIIELGIYRAHGDPWYAGDGYEHLQSNGLLCTRAVWDELQHIHGQVDYRGETFVVFHEAARRGMGGMDEGSPESVTVYRVDRKTHGLKTESE